MFIRKLTLHNSISEDSQNDLITHGAAQIDYVEELAAVFSAEQKLFTVNVWQTAKGDLVIYKGQ